MISGSFGLGTSGPGTLVLGGASTFSGMTTVGAGTLSISADSNLGSAPVSATPGSLTMTGGTLATTASFTLNANRGVSLGASGGTLDTASGTTLTYNGIIAGSGGLTKIDSGTLVLGGANTYTGTTSISTGKLSIAADQNLGTAPALATTGLLIVSGGTLVTTASFTLNANRGISLGTTGGTLDPVSGTTLTYNGIIAGAGFLGPKTNPGTLVLGGANTYTGATIINSGKLLISADNNLGTTPSSPTPGSLVISGGTLVSTATFTLSANRVISVGSSGGTLDPSAGTTLIYNGVIAGTGGLGPKLNSGTLVLGGANTYTGTTVVSAGTLEDAIANALPVTTTLTVQGSGTFDLAGFAQTVAGLADGGVSSGTVTDSGTAANFAVNDAGGNTFSGLVSGALSLSKTGLGALTLSHANTYSGPTTISTGRISISADNNLGAAPGSATPASLTLSGGALATTASFTLSSNRGISFGASGGTIDVAAGTTLTFNGIAAGAGGLTKIDTGTLVLGGVNTYSGATTISAGIDSVVVSNVFANTTSVTIAAGSELDLSGGITIASPLTSVAGTGSTGGGAIVNISGINALTGLITLAGNTTIDVGAGQLTLSGAIGDNGQGFGLTLVGGGTFVFSGPSSNTYAGATTLVSGTLELSKTNANAIPAGLVIGNGANQVLVQETASDQIFNSSTLTVISSGTLDLNTFNDAIFGVSMTGGAVQTETGVLTIYGNVTTNASSTTASISGNLALTTANGPTRTFTVASGTVPNNGPDLAVSAILSGAAAGLTKAGAGTLTLTGSNTYTGATIDNAGTLLVNGSQPGSAVTVNPGAILGGTGGAVGSVSVPGGALSPGGTSGGTGVLNAGNVNFSSAAAFNVNLNGTTAGSGYDELSATATVAIAASTTLSVTLGTGFTPAVGNTFTIIQSSAPISGTFASLPEGSTFAAGGQAFQISYKNDAVTLTSVGTATTSTVSSTLNPSVYGQTVTFTATVANTSGSGGVPTGSVAFYDGANLLGAGTTLSGSGTTATSTFANSTMTAGIHSISVIYTATGGFFGSTSTSLNQTVNTAALTITAVSQFKVYGAALPALTASYSGFVNGETSASLTTQPTLSTTATASSHVSGSPYTTTASGAVDSNYTIAYVGGSLTVTTAALTITANSQTKVYGAALPALTASYSGFVNGDTSASLTTQPTLATTATSSSQVSGSPYTITAGGAADTDYSITYVAGRLTVTTAPLTITAVNKTKNYGAALPTLTASYSGFVNGDTSASLTTQPTLITTAAASSHVAGNPYSVTASNAVDPNYLITYVAGTLTVNPVALTITAGNQTKAYGAALPTLTATYTGFVNGDTSASLSTQPTLATTASAGSHVSGSPYTITASGAADTDYTIGYVSGNLTVTAVPLVITANSQSKVYGAALPTLTASYAGLVNGDTSASLATQPTLATTATASSHISGNPYTITASGAADTDYSISYASGTLTVTQAPLTITANNQTMIYGGALPTLAASYSGLVNGDTVASLNVLPVLVTTATASSHVSGNPYSITASGAVDSDYSISYVSGNFTVTQAPLAITAVNKTMVYGAALPTLTVTYTGLANGDTAATFSNAGNSPPTASTAPATSHAGSYSITASGASNADYSISYVAGTLTITPVALSITANNQSKVYGAALPTLTASYSGFVNGDTSASLATQPTLTTTATASSHVSGNPYAVTASGAVDSDYTIGYVSGTLTVAAAPLTITAFSRQGLRRSDTDARRVVLWLRQWRHQR